MSNTFFQGGRKFSRGASPPLLPLGYELAGYAKIFWGEWPPWLRYHRGSLNRLQSLVKEDDNQ